MREERKQRRERRRETERRKRKENSRIIISRPAGQCSVPRVPDRQLSRPAGAETAEETMPYSNHPEWTRNVAECKFQKRNVYGMQVVKIGKFAECKLYTVSKRIRCQ